MTIEVAFDLLVKGGALGALVLVTAGFIFRVVISGGELKENNTRWEKAVDDMTTDRDYWRGKYDRLWDDYVSLSQSTGEGIRQIGRRRAS